MQTKLSKTEKADVRRNLSMFHNLGNGQVFSFPDRGVTVAIAPVFAGSRMALAAVAIAAPSEKKFRKLVGVNEALCKHQNGEGVQMVLSENFWTYSQSFQNELMEEMAENLAYVVVAG